MPLTNLKVKFLNPGWIKPNNDTFSSYTSQNLTECNLALYWGNMSWKTTNRSLCPDWKWSKIYLWINPSVNSHGEWKLEFSRNQKEADKQVPVGETPSQQGDDIISIPLLAAFTRRDTCHIGIETSWLKKSLHFLLPQFLLAIRPFK